MLRAVFSNGKETKMALGSRESDTLFNPISNMTEKEKRAYLSKQEQARQRNIELTRAEEEAKQQAYGGKRESAAQLSKRFRRYEIDASELDGCIKKTTSRHARLLVHRKHKQSSSYRQFG